jgi:circadian clock protein KaiC
VSERLTSGDRRLDDVLGGGLPANAINLVVGAPGAGKTILAQQYVFANATPERPAVYYSTTSEPFEKLLRYGQTLDFFDPRAVGEAVFYEDLADPLMREGLSAVTAAIGDALKERSAAIVVIDSFKALSAFAPSEDVFRRFLQEAAALLSAVSTSAFWIGEYEAAEGGHAPEFAVADTILALSAVTVNDRETRTLEVVKMRGSGYRTGAHAYRLSSSGMEVFPRLADPVEQKGGIAVEQRISSGIAALDAILAEGYWAGASTLVAGPTGSGKTAMGLQFIVSGARNGESGILATFEENPDQLERIAQGFGLSTREPGVELMYRSPVDLYVDEWVYELLDCADRIGATRLLIDGLTDLEIAAGDPTRHREYTYSLVQRCSRQGITLMMTSELPELYGVSSLSGAGVSHMSDNVIVLQYLPGEDGARLRRGMTVLKSRASRHRPQTHEFEITPNGIVLASEEA